MSNSPLVARGGRRSATWPPSRSDGSTQCAQVIPSAWLRLFNQAEVNELLSGGATGGADPQDMRSHAVYSGGYSPDSRTVKLFWQVGLPIWVPHPGLTPE